MCNETKTKIISCSNLKYNNYLDCLKDFCIGYCDSVEKSLIIDEELYNQGFSKYPVYTFSLTMKKEDIDKTLTLINNYYNLDYNQFEYYVEFYNLLKSLN